jgi:drug/metabolite transporter (DMT)-like permease
MSFPDQSRSPDRRVVAGHAALAAVQVFFGVFPVIGTLAFAPGGLSPLAVGAWRIVVGSLAIGGLAFTRFGRRAWPARTDLPLFFAAAMLGVAVNQGLFLVGLSRSTPMNAGLVMTLIPVFTFGIATVVRQERFSALRAVGVAVALAGSLPLLFSGGIGSLGAYGLGNLLMVANALCYSGYLVLSKVLTRRYPVIVIAAWAYICSLVAVPVFAAGQRLLPEPSATAAWWSLAYILVVPTVIAYLLNMFALARVRASTVAVYVYAQPIIAGLTSWIAFGERPTPSMVLAASGLFVGIWLVGRRPPPVHVLAEPGGPTGPA